jgi:hypothetical protein
LPLLRGFVWVIWAGFLALLDMFRDMLPGGRRQARRADEKPQQESRAVPRPPRMPSLTPTG